VAKTLTINLRRQTGAILRWQLHLALIPADQQRTIFKPFI
jgi:hypothetical protein